MTYLDCSINYWLTEICVWTLPFPPDGVDVDTYGSPIASFDTVCCCGDAVDEKYSSRGFSIYPNPAGNLLTIETSNPGQYTIEIISLNGQLLYSTKMEGSILQIDFSSFRKGIYFIKVRSRDYVRTEKIIKL